MKRMLLILAASAAILAGSLATPDTAEARYGWRYYGRPAVRYHYGYGAPHVHYYGYSRPYAYGYPGAYYSGRYREFYGPSFYVGGRRGMYYRY